MLLPRISTNVSVWPADPDGDPLGRFLASIAAFERLPEDTLVLPSHGLPFRGLHARIEDLIAHHHEQLKKVTHACREPKTALDILPIMFRRPLKGMHFLLAMAEALAHLEYLVSEARMRREPDAAGIVRYVGI